MTAFNSKVPLDNRIKSLLAAIILETQNDVEKFRKAVEAQFDSVMDRASGWFKRTQQGWTLAISALLVIACNVDTLAITHALSTNPEVRAKLVAIAEQKLEKLKKEEKTSDEESKTAKDAAVDAIKNVEKNPTDANKNAADATKEKAEKADAAAKEAKEKTAAATKSLEEAQTSLKAAGLPLGWPDQSSNPWWVKLAGLFISFCAVSLGAPFWFDILQRFMQIRGAGPTPAESKEKKKS